MCVTCFIGAFDLLLRECTWDLFDKCRRGMEQHYLENILHFLLLMSNDCRFQNFVPRVPTLSDFA